MSSQNGSAIARMKKRVASLQDQRKSEPAELFGVPIEVRGMFVGEREQFTDTAFELRGRDLVPVMGKFRAGLLFHCVYDPDTGKKVFGSIDAVKELIAGTPPGSRDDEQLDEVANLAQRLSGLDREAKRRAEGNSSGGPDASYGPSPEISDSSPTS